MPLLEALTLRFACDQTARSSMPNIGTESEVIIYKGNPHLIQCGVFAGEPSEDTFVDDWSNVSMASLVIRKHNAKGTVLIEKVLDPDSINGALTYDEWVAGTAAHVEFELSDVDTNQVVPSDKTLDIYGAINLSTPRGPITIGFFTGVIKDDGTGNPGEPITPDYTSYSRAEIDALLSNIAPPQGLGNVTGPNGATANRIATFSGFTGQVIQDSGYTISDLAQVNTVVNLTTDQNVAGIKTFSASPIVPDATALDSTGKVANTKFVTSAITTMANTLSSTIATKQPSSTPGTALANLTLAADKMIYATSASVLATTTLSSFARTLLDDADATTMRATLGVGSGSGDASTNTSTSVDSELVLFNSTSGKSLKRASGTGIVLATSGVASYLTNNSTNWNTAYSERNNWDGGTGGFFVAATARTSLGLVIGTNVQAYSANLSTIAMASTTTSFGANLLAQSDAANARTYLGVGTGTGDASTDVTESVAGGLAVFANTTGKVFTTIGTASVRGLENVIHIAARSDGVDGTGTSEDPYDASTQEKFDDLINSLPENSTVHLARNQTFSTKGFTILSGLHLLGDGSTIQMADQGATSHLYVQYVANGTGAVTSGVIISGITFDLNLAGQSASEVVIGAVNIYGSYNRIENCRGINWGCKGAGTDECFVFSLGTVEGAGASYGNKIINCIVDTPAEVDMTGANGVTAFAVGGNNNTGGGITTPGDGWDFGGEIAGCIVRDVVVNDSGGVGQPQFFHGFGTASSVGCNIHNNFAYNLTGTGNAAAMYYDTWSVYSHSIQNNNFYNVFRGIRLLTDTTSFHVQDWLISGNHITAISEGIGLGPPGGTNATRFQIFKNVIRPTTSGGSSVALVNVDSVLIDGNVLDHDNPVTSYTGLTNICQVNNFTSAGVPTGSAPSSMSLDSSGDTNFFFKLDGTAKWQIGNYGSLSNAFRIYNFTTAASALEIDAADSQANFTGAVKASGYKSSDGSTGSTTTTGGLTFKNGLLTSGSVSSIASTDLTDSSNLARLNAANNFGGGHLQTMTRQATGSISYALALANDATSGTNQSIRLSLLPHSGYDETNSPYMESFNTGVNAGLAWGTYNGSLTEKMRLSIAGGLSVGTTTDAGAGYILTSNGYKSTDGTAGATATTGGLTFKNGLYTSGSLSSGLTIGSTSISSGSGSSKVLYDNSGTLGEVDLSAIYQPLDSDLTSWAAITRASGFDTFVATPSSANLRSLLTDETGTGAAVFADTPTLVTPNIGVATGTSVALTALSTITLAPGANTASPGLQLINSTTASSGNQQYSPTLRWTGQGWKTGSGGASQAVDFRQYVIPVQSGATTPHYALVIDGAVNGGSFGRMFWLGSVNTAANGAANNGAVLSIGTNDNGGIACGYIGGDGTSNSTAALSAVSFRMQSGGIYQWNSTTGQSSGGADTGLARNAAGVVEVNNATAGQWGALKVGIRDSGTTTVTNGLTVGHQSTGTPAAGLGSGILFNINSSTTADQNAAQIASLWSDATHASRTSRFVVSTVFSAGSLVETFSVSQIAAGDAIARFGGTSSSFPALKRSSATLQARLADDSAYADFAAAKITLNGVLKLKSYPAASPPSPDEGGLIWLPDETGGPVVAYSDGSQWLRIDNNTLVSAA